MKKIFEGVGVESPGFNIIVCHALDVLEQCSVCFVSTALSIPDPLAIKIITVFFNASFRFDTRKFTMASLARKKTVSSGPTVRKASAPGVRFTIFLVFVLCSCSHPYFLICTDMQVHNI